MTTAPSSQSAPNDGVEPTEVFVEVTETISVPYTTGIQRVVREVAKGLVEVTDTDPTLQPRFVVRRHESVPFRLLTDEEQAALSTHPPGGQTGRRADNFGILSPLVRRIGDLSIVINTRVFFRDMRARKHERQRIPELEIPHMPAGSIFFDMEGSWYAPVPRSQLLPELRKNGVQIAVFIHDVLPIIHPEWFVENQVTIFKSWFKAHIENSSLIITNTEYTANDLRKVAADFGVTEDLNIAVAPLGATIPNEGTTPVELPPGIDQYLLVVGTLEPRKNQRLVIDAFEELHEKYPNLGLVLVGKEGWMVSPLVKRIRQHPLLDDRLLWLGGLTDSEVGWLYRNAALSVVPSLYEGFGLPIVESLSYGCPTISSLGGALVEAGGPSVEYFDAESSDARQQLMSLIERFFEDDTFRQTLQQRATDYVRPQWDETVSAVVKGLKSLTK